MDSQQLLASSSAVPSVPLMAVERFAELVGVTPDVVRGWVDRGYLPTQKIGRYRLINIAVLTREALQNSE